jgi:F-type H+-transporting ATPase subunit b
MDILASLQSIGFDWQVALAHLVNFLLVVWLLNRFVFSPLQDTVENRQEKIEQGVAEAKKAKEKLREAKSEREAILSAAKDKRQEIVTEARQQADEIIAEAKEEAREEAETIKRQARKDMKKQRKQMQQEVRDAVGKLAVQSAEKILQREVSEDDHDKLVKDVVNTKVDHA